MRNILYYSIALVFSVALSLSLTQLSPFAVAAAHYDNFAAVSRHFLGWQLKICHYAVELQSHASIFSLLSQAPFFNAILIYVHIVI